MLEKYIKQMLIVQCTRPIAFPHIPRKLSERDISYNTAAMALKIYHSFIHKYS